MPVNPRNAGVSRLLEKKLPMYLLRRVASRDPCLVPPGQNFHPRKRKV